VIDQQARDGEKEGPEGVPYAPELDTVEPEVKVEFFGKALL